MKLVGLHGDQLVVYKYHKLSIKPESIISITDTMRKPRSSNNITGTQKIQKLALRECALSVGIDRNIVVNKTMPLKSFENTYTTTSFLTIPD